MPAVSICITILNEEKTIKALLTALAKQTISPQEIIVADGGSSDNTVLEVRRMASQLQLPLQLFVAKGNRSVGRNAAIGKSKSGLIAITDAGCIPHHNWLEELLKAHATSRAEVIAGYYDAVAANCFEEAMIPFVLVMPDKVNPKSFLPATRSMLLTKKIWHQVGGFDERFSDNEDYAFAKKIAAVTSISFVKAAKVTWIPRQNIQQFYTMLFRFARGDIQAGLLRPKVIFLFVRYLAAIGLLCWLSWNNELFAAFAFTAGGLFLYAIWSIVKNMRYTPRGWFWLPVLQFTADVAVIFGSIAGAIKRLMI